MYIDKHLGHRIVFAGGFSIGFAWIHCGGETTKSSAILAAYHPPQSITWLWALDWTRPARLLCHPAIRKWSAQNGSGSTTLVLPFIGSFTLRRQEPMWRKNGKAQSHV